MQLEIDPPPRVPLDDAGYVKRSTMMNRQPEHIDNDPGEETSRSVQKSSASRRTYLFRRLAGLFTSARFDRKLLLRRAGITGIIFFTVKGLMWLVLSAVIFLTQCETNE